MELNLFSIGLVTYLEVLGNILHGIKAVVIDRCGVVNEELKIMNGRE